MNEADDDAAVAAKRNRWGSLELQCNNAINETAEATLVSAAEDETRSSKRPRHFDTTPSQQVQNQKLDQPSNGMQTESTTTSTISLKDWMKKSDVDNRIDQCVKIAYKLVVKLNSSSVDVEDEEHLSCQIIPKPKDICEECITITMDTSTGEVCDVGFVSIYQNSDWGDDDIDMNIDVLSNKRQELGLIFEALGKLFYKLFMNGEEPPQFNSKLNNAESISLSHNVSSGSVPTEDDVIKMLSQQPKQKCANARILSTMRNKGLPSSVCHFITDLFDSSRIDVEEEDCIQSKTSDSFFTSLMEVQLELKQMIDSPEAYLYGTITSRWDIVFGNNHMFGREAELKQLKDVVDNTEKKKELVLISGRAGTGKTRLVNEMRKSLLSKGWIFLRCKFGKTVHSRSLSVIALGIDMFFSSEMCGATVVEKGYDRLVHLIGVDGIKYLCQYMPGLRRLVNRKKNNKENSLNDGTTSMPAEYSDLYLISSLLDTISSINRVLFFVDDLQWADEESLKLLNSLVSHKTTSCDQSHKIIFVCAYRDNEINKDFFHMNDTSENINTTQITLCGFNREILNELISNALCLPRRKTKSLAESILSKTKGIPLYVVEFLDALWTEKLLVQSEGQWEWDCDVIDLKAINRGVAVLLADQLKDLQADIQHGLQILACFGFCHVDIEVLEAVNAMSALKFAKKEGFVDSAGTQYTFAHSIIQQAAYDMISYPDRKELLERLVTCLVPRCMQKGSSDHVLFVTIGLINKIGSDFPPPQSKLYAKLNLRAGEISMNSSDFVAAIKYFTSGISLLGSNLWKDEYELSLSLFEQTASAYYSQGNHEQQVVEYSNQVLENAASFEDKFNSHCVSINVVAKGSIEKACAQVHDILHHLGGEPINPNMPPTVAITEFMTMRGTLAGQDKDVFLHMKQMTDRNKLMTMKMLGMLALYYGRMQSFMLGYISCRMLRITIEYGHSEDSVFALASFAAALGNRFNDFDESCALAHTALGLMKKYNMEKMIPRVYGMIYGAGKSAFVLFYHVNSSVQYEVSMVWLLHLTLVFLHYCLCNPHILTDVKSSLFIFLNLVNAHPPVLISKEPLTEMADNLLKGVRLSFENGCQEYSIMNTVFYLSRSWQAGKNLLLLVQELEAFSRKHQQHNHSGILKMLLAPSYRVLSSLTGIKSSSVLSKLPSVNTADLIEQAKSKKEMIFVQIGVSSLLFEVFTSRDFIKASEVILQYPLFFQSLNDSSSMMVNQFGVLYFAGLVCFHMTRRTKEQHWLTKGMNVLASYSEWAKTNEVNFSSRFLLLKAELHYTKGHIDEAIIAYDHALELAEKYKFIDQVALICECAAIFYGENGKQNKTKEFLKRSHDAYMKWGAEKKAKEIISLVEI